MPTSTFSVVSFGAVGDGYADDSVPVAAAFAAARQRPTANVYFPAGEYLLLNPPNLTGVASRLAVTGDGANASIIYTRDSAGLSFQFEMSGIQQPFGLTLKGLGLRALGTCGRALRVSYGAPPVINDHSQCGVRLDDVQVNSSAEGQWANGIELESVWNADISHVYASGNDCSGVWNNLSGSGLSLVGSCINAHISNSRFNFWAEGLKAHAGSGPNTEGIFCSNNSLVACKRGVSIKGNAAVMIGNESVPRISTLTWVGGLIEVRSQGVQELSCAFELTNVWTALITGAQMLSEHIPEENSGKITYGVLPMDSRGVVVSGCDINAWNYGVHTAGECRAIAATGCTFTNVKKQVIFPAGTSDSRSYGHVLTNETPFEWTGGNNNKMGFV